MNLYADGIRVAELESFEWSVSRYAFPDPSNPGNVSFTFWPDYYRGKLRTTSKTKLVLDEDQSAVVIGVGSDGFAYRCEIEGFTLTDDCWMDGTQEFTARKVHPWTKI